MALGGACVRAHCVDDGAHPLVHTATAVSVAVAVAAQTLIPPAFISINRLQASPRACDSRMHELVLCECDMVVFVAVVPRSTCSHINCVVCFATSRNRDTMGYVCSEHYVAVPERCVCVSVSVRCAPQTCFPTLIFFYARVLQSWRRCHIRIRKQHRHTHTHTRTDTKMCKRISHCSTRACPRMCR